MLLHQHALSGSPALQLAPSHCHLRHAVTPGHRSWEVQNKPEYHLLLPAPCDQDEWLFVGPLQMMPSCVHSCLCPVAETAAHAWTPTLQQKPRQRLLPRESAAERVTAATQYHAAVVCKRGFVNKQGASSAGCGVAAWLHLWAAANLQLAGLLSCPTDRQHATSCCAHCATDHVTVNTGQL